jgi:hypothetical protein
MDTMPLQTDDCLIPAQLTPRLVTLLPQLPNDIGQFRKHGLLTDPCGFPYQSNRV